MSIGWFLVVIDENAAVTTRDRHGALCGQFCKPCREARRRCATPARRVPLRAAAAAYQSRAGPPLRLRSIRPRRPSRDYGDAVGFEPFLAVDDVDPHPLPGREGVDAAAAQGGDMDEDVLSAAIGRNEPVAFFGFKPLHRALDQG